MLTCLVNKHPPDLLTRCIYVITSTERAFPPSPVLLRAVLEESAYGRIKQVVRWYLSGFYKKPKVGGDVGSLTRHERHW